MNKYQEALDEIKSTEKYDLFDEYIDDIFEKVKVFADEDEAIATLQELVDLTKSGEYYNKKDLIDELDKVYTVAKKHYYHLIHYADIYRIIEKVVQDE